jgi:hypothetical protein
LEEEGTRDHGRWKGVQDCSVKSGQSCEGDDRESQFESSTRVADSPKAGLERLKIELVDFTYVCDSKLMTWNPGERERLPSVFVIA